MLIASFQGLQRAQNLRHGNAARRRRRHAADLPAFVVGTKGRALLGAVVGQVAQRQAARVGVPLDLGHDLLRNGPFVEGIRPFLGDALQHGGQGWIFQQRAGGFRAAIGIEEIR
ncbi:hypothetical protein D3C80_1744700 [compost metagenome]